MRVVYVGCGQSPIRGGINFDNSPAIFFAKHKLICFIGEKMGLFKEEQIRFINFIRKNKIKYGDAKKLSLEDNSVDVIYSCHTLEHLYCNDLKKSVEEAYRVLKPAGIFRVVLPDLGFLLEKYMKNGDADEFCRGLYMSSINKPAFRQRLQYFFIGNRDHKWMYDSKSIKKLIESISEFKVTILQAGQTLINFESGINLKEREVGSLYIECVK